MKDQKNNPETNYIILDDVVWTGSQGREQKISEMHPDHRLRAFLFLLQRYQLVKNNLEHLPQSKHEEAFAHNGRRLTEWLLIFKTFFEREESQSKSERRLQIEKQLKELESVEQRRTRLEKELQELED